MEHTNGGSFCNGFSIRNAQKTECQEQVNHFKGAVKLGHSVATCHTVSWLKT